MDVKDFDDPEQWNGGRLYSAINGGPQEPFNWAPRSPHNRQPVCRPKLAAGET